MDVGDAVVEQVLKISDLLYLWQPIFMYSCYVRDKKKRISMISLEKKIKYRPISSKKRKKAFADMIILGIMTLIFTSVFITKVEWGRFGKMWNRESVVSSFGIFTYQINDICQSLQPKINNLFGHDKALKKVIDFYDSQKVNVSDNEYSNVFEGMNVIVIHAESLQTKALNCS